jgi:predicted nuclease of predicted toxin-antitoxin system
MKFKLDENVDLRILPQFRLAGYDVVTVPSQKMMSAPDTELIEVCHQEGRCLVTADRDFSNRGRYNPSNYSGIAVIRLPSQVQLSDWREAIATLISGLETSSVTGKLWIIQGDRIQEYRPDVKRSVEDE